MYVEVVSKMRLAQGKLAVVVVCSRFKRCNTGLSVIIFNNALTTAGSCPAALFTAATERTPTKVTL